MSTSLSKKVDQASQFVKNAEIGNNTPVEEKTKFIWECLAELGIEDDEVSHEVLLSEDTTKGDFLAVFHDTRGVPKPFALRIWSTLREGKEDEKQPEEPSTMATGIAEAITSVLPVNAASLKDSDLLSQYNLHCSTEIESELVKRSNGRPCIVFTKDNEVNMDISLELLRQARRSQTSTVYPVDGTVCRVYPIGEFPNTELYLTCPVTGCVLQNNYSEDLGVFWETDEECLIFVKFLLEEDDSIDIDVFRAREIMKVYKEGGINALKALFLNTVLAYDERHKLGQLPSVRTTSSEIRQAKKSDPFRPGNRRR
jgi:hypothetical protein